ncbi:hypothetical protein ACSBR2_019902 [Camellia fascicularis]
MDYVSYPSIGIEIITEGEDLGSKIKSEKLGFVNKTLKVLSENMIKVVETTRSCLVREKGGCVDIDRRDTSLNQMERGVETSNPSVDLQIITDRLERLKEPDRGLTLGTPMIHHPDLQGLPSTPVAPTIQSPKWFDLVEDGQQLRFLDLPDSLMVARAQGINHSTMESKDYATNSTSPSSSGVGLGLSGFKVGDPTTSENVIDLGDRNLYPMGQGPLYGGGSLQGHGRRAHANVRGGQGGRGPNRGPENRSWANIAAAPVGSEVKLQYYPPKISQDKIVVELPPVSPLAKWEACLVGYFIDKRLPYSLIKNSAFNMWKNKGLLEVQMNDEGFVFFVFENQDCCQNVLDGGPWYAGGFLIILKLWHRMMKLSKEDKKTIPIWVKFFNDPMEYWDGDGLSRITSAVAVPLFMDQLTSSGERISFARVCVNIEAESPLPESFCITSEGEVVDIRVEYQGVPTRCTPYNVFGNDTKSCVSAQVTKLIELQKTTEEKSVEDDGWTKVKDKGKRTIGEPSLASGHVEVQEVSSSSIEGGVELCAEVGDIITKATEQVTNFHSAVLDIVQIIHPNAEEIIREVKLGVGMEEESSPTAGNNMKRNVATRSSTKQKSSGKSSS